EGGCVKRKWIPVQRAVYALNGCLCGIVVNPKCEGALKSRQAGCETQWYHLHCVNFESEPKNWMHQQCLILGPTLWHCGKLCSAV
ncbi:hypothetical protein HYPSUDRAFT_140472, partial [Hypholoma sublateritium FD-334 SS-4]